MMGDLYRLKANGGDKDKYLFPFDNRFWVFACSLTEYPDDTEILVVTDEGKTVVLFSDLDDWLARNGVIIG